MTRGFHRTFALFTTYSCEQMSLPGNPSKSAIARAVEELQLKQMRSTSADALGNQLRGNLTENPQST